MGNAFAPPSGTAPLSRGPGVCCLGAAVALRADGSAVVEPCGAPACQAPGRWRQEVVADCTSRKLLCGAALVPVASPGEAPSGGYQVSAQRVALLRACRPALNTRLGLSFPDGSSLAGTLSRASLGFLCEGAVLASATASLGGYPGAASSFRPIIVFSAAPLDVGCLVSLAGAATGRAGAASAIIARCTPVTRYALEPPPGSAPAPRVDVVGPLDDLCIQLFGQLLARLSAEAATRAASAAAELAAAETAGCGPAANETPALRPDPKETPGQPAPMDH